MNQQLESLDTINLLLIEACKSDAVLVKANLRCSEHPIFAVRHEETCQSGIRALSESDTDVILLDLNLPDSTGLDTLRAVKEFAQGIPIVVISELSSKQEGIEAVLQGAQDCFEKSEAITKPLGQPLQYSIERFHREHAERDIASAAFVQRRLFPTSLPAVPGYDVSGRCDPANHVGGDYFDYFLVDRDQLIVVIGDVTGHGFGPSLVMAETRAALRTMAATTSDVGTMIDQVNNLIHDHDFHWFVTLFLGRIDTKTGHCSFASAAQPAILMRADGSVEELYSQDHPLGIATDVTFGVYDVQFHVGDTLLLYTDGISERASAPTEFFGIERIHQLLAITKDLSAAETIDKIFAEANQFAEFRTSVDDMTAVVVKVTQAGEEP